ncbi:MAG: hypothetical protein GY820_01175 [Gammaproteobacteria bacterium]|nr:hypothetical protein [Gammaproteobacteria bacterium]
MPHVTNQPSDAQLGYGNGLFRHFSTANSRCFAEASFQEGIGAEVFQCIVMDGATVMNLAKRHFMCLLGSDQNTSTNILIFFFPLGNFYM